MSLKSRNHPSHIHFIGIGGIGMSALARWFKSQKWAVFGSDSAEGDWVQELKKDGLYVKIGHKKGHIRPEIGLIIYNQAIPEANPELKESRRLNLPTLTYPEMLGALTNHYTTFAVAGAHGKSTTTALLSLVLIKAGFDPTVIVGTKLKEFGSASGSRRSNFRAGKQNNFVIEADEFKGSFWHYSPTYAIITNIDREHLDFYKNLANIKKSFLKFIKNIKPDGLLVLNRDNKYLFGLRGAVGKITKANKIRIIWYSLKDKDVGKIKKFLKVPGIHNVSNALAVYKLARALGIKENIILKAIAGFKGTWRRFEYRGNLELRTKNKESGDKNNTRFTIPVYDDYAHHPTEIKATLQAFKERYPKHKLVCVFQPHQAKRLKLLFRDFVHAFDDANKLILLPTYQVVGRDKVNSKYNTSKQLAGLIPHCTYLADAKKLPSVISRLLSVSNQVSFVVIMMGAGTVVKYTDELIKKFR